MKFAIYSRKSRLSEKGNSVENQVQMCKDYILSHFEPKEIDNITVYEDDGYSGSNIKRPEFTKLINHINEGLIDCIICYRLDRISRNIKDFSDLIYMLDSKNISFISIKEQFDTSTPMGRAMMYISSVFSQLERETIAQRVKDNLDILASKGLWLGGTTPYGYRSKKVYYENSSKKNKYYYILEENYTEFKTVKLIFSLYLHYFDINYVIKILEEKNLKNRSNSNFSHYLIRGILKNPVYASCDKYIYNYFLKKSSTICNSKFEFDGTTGIMSYNKRYKNKLDFNNYERWIIAKGYHSYAVSGKDWVIIQSHLHKNNKKTIKPEIYCGKCGNKMYIKRNKSYSYYVCSNKNKNGIQICNQKNISEKDIDVEIQKNSQKLIKKIICTDNKISIII